MAHLATVVTVRPRMQSAAVTISIPWHTTATGFLASKKWRVIRSRSWL